MSAEDLSARTGCSADGKRVTDRGHSTDGKSRHRNRPPCAAGKCELPSRPDSRFCSDGCGVLNAEMELSAALRHCLEEKDGIERGQRLLEVKESRIRKGEVREGAEDCRVRGCHEWCPIGHGGVVCFGRPLNRCCVDGTRSVGFCMIGHFFFFFCVGRFIYLIGSSGTSAVVTKVKYTKWKKTELVDRILRASQNNQTRCRDPDISLTDPNKENKTKAEPESTPRGKRKVHPAGTTIDRVMFNSANAQGQLKWDKSIYAQRISYPWLKLEACRY